MTQPAKTIGKVVKYMCNGKWHHPFFADNLNWAKTGIITPHSVITQYEIIRCSPAVLRKLTDDLKLGLRKN